jgi:hypothetical protein
LLLFDHMESKLSSIWKLELKDRCYPLEYLGRSEMQTPPILILA